MDVREKLSDLAISDKGFVFDPYTGSTFSLNATGRVMLEGLKRGAGRGEILDDLTEAFTVGADEDLDRDLGEFMQLLRREGLVPADFVL
jgi:PqqD family protein of HPr-rel-A system